MPPLPNPVANGLPDKMISAAYLLVLNIELRRHDGRYWAEPLWHRDLMLHLDTIERLTLFCPVRDAVPPPDWQSCDNEQLEIAPVAPLGRLAALRLPALAAKLWRAIGRAQIVHIGVAGWPFPLGWIAAPIARLRRRFLLILVESSFWRVNDTNASPLRRFRARLFERINRACVNACDISFFTTDAYRRELATHPRGPTVLAPASWLDEAQILSPAAAAEIAGRRNGRLLFAGRMIAAKGVLVLLDALRQCPLPVDIVGSGELADACARLAAELPDHVRLLDPVPYGDAFSAMIERYQALIVPSLSGEQPRIIFDAFARAVPVIASETGGHVALVRDGETGLIVPAGDARALAGAMQRAIAQPALFAAMGMTALESVRERTHSAMHRQRARAIAQAYAGRGR